MRVSSVAPPLLLLLSTLLSFTRADEVAYHNFSYSLGNYGPSPVQSYLSSNLSPPIFNYIEQSLAPSDLYTFIGVRGHDAPHPGPMIFDDTGSLVWAGHGFVLNFQKQIYKGMEVLTYFTGSELWPGYGHGQWQIYNQNYEIVAFVEAQGVAANLTDPHDFIITSNNTAVIEFWVPTKMDLRSIGGNEDAWVFDCIVQEINIETTELLFEWHSIDHIQPADSFYDLLQEPTRDDPFDYVHMNSIQKDQRGNYIFGMRGPACAVYVDAETGSVLWRLGGKTSDFAMLGSATFWYQHHVRLLDSPELPSNIREVSLFDNGANQFRQNAQAARGLVLRLDTDRMTARLAREYPAPFAEVCSSEGSVQHLSNGNVVVGWGIRAYFSEYESSGRLLQHVQFAAKDASSHSYRVYKDTWKGYPKTPPALHLSASNQASVSWNGATEVREWGLLTGASSSPQTLQLSGTYPKGGFETTFEFDILLEDGFVAIVGLDAKGKCLGVSAIHSRSNLSTTGIEGTCVAIRDLPSLKSMLVVGALTFLLLLLGRYGYRRALREQSPATILDEGYLPMSNATPPHHRHHLTTHRRTTSITVSSHSSQPPLLEGQYSN